MNGVYAYVQEYQPDNPDLNQFLTSALQAELDKRHISRQMRLLRQAGFPTKKRFEDLVTDTLPQDGRLHQKTDIDNSLIREIENTTAKLHDSQVDLSREGEVVLRDKDYFGVQARGDDFTMKRRTTDAPLGELDKERNRLISKLRSPGERPHAVIKRVFSTGMVLVTTVKIVRVKMMAIAFAFNLYQLCTLKSAQII